MTSKKRRVEVFDGWQWGLREKTGARWSWGAESGAQGWLMRWRGEAESFDGLGGRLSDEAQSADQLSAVMSLPACCTMTSSAPWRGAQQRSREPASALQWSLLYKPRTLCLQNCIDPVFQLEDFPKQALLWKDNYAASNKKTPSLQLPRVLLHLTF